MSTNHQVKQGECLASIAVSYGFLPETVWLTGENAGLRDLRGDSCVLMPGDRLHIPDPQMKKESGGTEARHRFVRKGVPAMLRLQITIDDEPRANEPYQLDIDGILSSGSTDANGMLEAPIPADAKKGMLTFTKSGQQDCYPLGFGTLDPIDTESGAKGRLHALGYNDELALQDLLLEFQHDQNLDPSGLLDSATRARLKTVFGQ